MLTAKIKFFGELDDEEVKKFIENVKEMPFGQLFNRHSCSKIFRVQIASTDKGDADISGDTERWLKA